jgi:hypothetical protein
VRSVSGIRARTKRTDRKVRTATAPIDHGMPKRSARAPASSAPSELPDGLAFRFPAVEYDAVTEFVGRERLCCPFITFELDIAPNCGMVLLRLTGAEGVKDFIRAELHLPAIANR